jgi:hypothetical protein
MGRERGLGRCPVLLLIVGTWTRDRLCEGPEGDMDGNEYRSRDGDGNMDWDRDVDVDADGNAVADEDEDED